MHILGLNSFLATKLKFHSVYIYTDWGMRTVAFAGVGILLMADISVYGIMGKLQCSYPENCYELVEMLDIDLN